MYLTLADLPLPNLSFVTNETANQLTSFLDQHCSRLQTKTINVHSCRNCDSATLRWSKGLRLSSATATSTSATTTPSASSTSAATTLALVHHLPVSASSTS